MSQFGMLQESGKDIYESVRDERPYRQDGNDANLCHPGRGVPDMATCETDLFLKPG